MKWTPTKGRTPRTGEAPLRVRFRNGSESRYAAPARAWQFGHGRKDFPPDWDFDIIEVAKA